MAAVSENTNRKEKFNAVDEAFVDDWTADWVDVVVVGDDVAV